MKKTLYPNGFIRMLPFRTGNSILIWRNIRKYFVLGIQYKLDTQTDHNKPETKLQANLPKGHGCKNSELILSNQIQQ